MALSGVYTQTMSEVELIKDAMVLLGVQDASESLKATDQLVGRRRLNYILNHWQNFGVQLWKKQWITVILEINRTNYRLGQASAALQASTHAAPYNDMWYTTLSAAGASGDSTLTVTSIAATDVAHNNAPATADTVVVVLDDGSLYEDTINGAPSGSTITLTNTLGGAAASGNRVFAYTSAAARPYRVLEAVRRDSSQYDVPIHVVGEQEYFNYPDKNSSSQPHTVAYLPRSAAEAGGSLFVYPPADSGHAGTTLELLAEQPFDMFTDSTDEPDIPKQGHLALMYALAESLGIDFHTDSDTMSRIRKMAQSTFNEFMAADQERLTLHFEPNFTMGRGL